MTVASLASRGFVAPFLVFFAVVRGSDDSTCGAALKQAGRIIVSDICPERDLSVCQLRTKNDLSRCDGEGWWRMKQHGSGRWEAWFAEAAAQDNNWPPITPACAEPASGRAGGATSDAREAGEPNSISRGPFVSSEVRGSRRWAQHHQIWPRRS